MPWPTVVETTGTELVTNGTFDTDLTGWTLSKGTATVNAGAATVTANGIERGMIHQIIPTVVGQLYIFSGTHTGGGSGPFIGISLGNWSLKANISDAALQAGVAFTATTTTTYLHLETSSATAGASKTYDNISVKEINPLSVSIQMDGRMTYADNNQSNEVMQYRWRRTSSNYISTSTKTSSSRTGMAVFAQRESVSGADSTVSSANYYSPDINVPFNIASRHGSTFINGAVDGTALTANTTPTALPDLSATDFQIGYIFMGNLGKLRVWADDLGETGIAEATLPSTEPSLSLTFDGSETSFTVLDWSE
jgi:hypothetical protein